MTQKVLKLACGIFMNAAIGSLTPVGEIAVVIGAYVLMTLMLWVIDTTRSYSWESFWRYGLSREISFSFTKLKGGSYNTSFLLLTGAVAGIVLL